MTAVLLSIPSFILPLVLLGLGAWMATTVEGWMPLKIGLLVAGVAGMAYNIHVVRMARSAYRPTATELGRTLAMLPVLGLAVGIAAGLVVAALIEIAVQTWTLLNSGFAVVPMVRLVVAVAVLAVLLLRSITARRRRRRG